MHIYPGEPVLVKPKLLIITDRSKVRESACILAGTMGFQCVAASRIEDVLASSETEKAVATVLDLPSDASDPGKIGQDFSELLGRMQGRLVVLTGERAAQEMGDLEKKYSVPFVQRDRLAVELLPCLGRLIFSQPTIRKIIQVASLVLDTFLQPAPVGIRTSRTGIRQLVYESDHFTTDISFEHLPDSTLTTACGQIMREADPRIPLNGVSILMKGEKGPLELKMTNQCGEFSFKFENERKVTFEIEVNYGHWIAIVSPILEWNKAARAGLRLN